MAQKKKTRKKVTAQTRRKAAPKKKTAKAKKATPKRKAAKKLVKKTPVQPLEPEQPVIQDDTTDLEERQEQIHDAEDAIVDEADEEELGEAV